MRFGLLSLLFGCGRQPDGGPPQQIDLARFRYGDATLGEPLDPGSPLGKAFVGRDRIDDVKHGIEIGVADGVLDYLFITLDRFDAGLARHGESIRLTAASSPEDVTAIFGESYWTDRNDNPEVLMFYEYPGNIELQFEFPDGRSLGFITLMRNGILTGAEQRRAYGVTKPWPP